MQIASWTAEQVEAQAKSTAQAANRIEKDPPDLPAPLAPLKVARERLAILVEVAEAAKAAAASLNKVLCYTDPNAKPQDIPHLVPGNPLQAEGRTPMSHP